MSPSLFELFEDPSMKCMLALIPVSAAVLMAPLPIFATPIVPGTTVIAAPVTTGAITSADTVAMASGSLGAVTFAGTWMETVFQDAQSPFSASCGTGCLTFLIQVADASGNAIEHVTTGDGINPTVMHGFQYFLTNVGYEGTGNTPLSIDESADGVVSFDFPGADAIGNGASSAYLLIQTSATNVTPGLVSAIDSSTSTVNGYIPSVAIAVTPEPSSLLLLGTALAATAGLVGRRKRLT